MPARREIEVEATPEEVWEAISTEEGRERWLDEPEREIRVESEDPPNRLVWWWWEGDEEPSRVEILVTPAPDGARVVVTESRPAVPMARLAAALTPALAPV
ncbi:MAG: SRPBCC domain-containing protein [Thermoleophilia bacterium]